MIMAAGPVNQCGISNTTIVGVVPCILVTCSERVQYDSKSIFLSEPENNFSFGGRLWTNKFCAIWANCASYIFSKAELAFVGVDGVIVAVVWNGFVGVM